MRQELKAHRLIALLAVASLGFAIRGLCVQTGNAKPQLPIEGKLVQLPGTGPVLQVKGKDYELSARTTWLFHTLQDKRLTGREIRAEGAWQPDGTLKVNRFYTVHNGQLFRVRYFCEVCNIEALEPGNCVCCQQPTEMQEIPVPEK